MSNVKKTKRASYGEVFRFPKGTAIFIQYLDKINSAGGEYPSNKFEISIVIPKAEIKPLAAKIAEVARVHFDNPAMKFSEIEKHPLKDGDAMDTTKYPIYEGTYAVVAKRKEQQGAPKIYAKNLSQGKPVVLDSKAIYAGCPVFVYGSVGVAKINGDITAWFDLHSVQVAGEGTRLGGNNPALTEEILISCSSEEEEVSDILGLNSVEKDEEDEVVEIKTAPKAGGKKAAKPVAVDPLDINNDEPVVAAPKKAKVSAVSLLDAI